MIQRRSACANDVNRPRWRAQGAPPADVEVAEEHDPAREWGEHGAQGRGVQETVTQLHQARPCIHWGMVDQDDRRAPLYRRVGEQVHERFQLLPADVSASDKWGTRNGA